MKKIISLSLLSLTLLVGCGGGKVSSTSTASTSETTSKATTSVTTSSAKPSSSTSSTKPSSSSASSATPSSSPTSSNEVSSVTSIESTSSEDNSSIATSSNVVSTSSEETPSSDVSSVVSSDEVTSSEDSSSVATSSNVVSTSSEATSNEVSSVVSSDEVTSSEISSNDTVSSSSEENSSLDQIGTTIYFIDSSWWNKDAAASYIYVWDSTTTKDNYKVVYPGEMMTHLKWDEETKTNTWSYVIDLDTYDYCVLSRRSGDGKNDWGAKTIDIHLTDEFNTIILSDEAKWFGDGNKATVSFDTLVVNL